MKKILTAVLFLALALPIFAHDLFLKLDSFFVEPNAKVVISVLNGSFTASEGAVNFERLKDLSVVSPANVRTNPKEADWTKNETTSFLNLQPSESGNYVVGLATLTREISLKAKDFNEYLAEDGIPNILADRKRTKSLEKDAKERYSKYVKTIFQVGDKQSDNYKTVLGYAVELVPQQNPYALKVGDSIEILCLKEGKPLANQLVMSGFEKEGKSVAAAGVRSDKKGLVKIKLSEKGKWFVKFILMQKSTEKGLDYESKWANLTFELR